MFKRKENAFTLIELIATIVIMAIIALIVTPLVMTIIRKARISADRRSIDAYGRSIELAIASHLLDTGKFATSIDELTIEYSGNKVECETTQINPDSSVYLSDCKVNNREVTNYTYGTDKSPSYESYQVGDHVSYNGVNYYVIEDSDTKNNIVKLLKEEPLKPSDLEGITFDDFTLGEQNGYTTVAYGTSTDYNSSYVKQVVDNWTSSFIVKIDLKESRLITKTEIDDNFEFVEVEYKPCGDSCGIVIKRNVFSKKWMYNANYDWFMQTEFESDKVYNIKDIGIVDKYPIYGRNAIRPVVELYKTATITKLES